MVTLGSSTETYSMCSRFWCSISRAVAVTGALMNASIISRPIRMGCPCLPPCSGTTAHLYGGAASNAARNLLNTAALAGGRSTSVIIAASRPIQHFMQANLKGTELPTLGVGISEQKCAVRVRHRCELRLVIPSDDDHQVILLAKCAYCGREKSLSAGGRSRTARRPGQQGFVPTHAGRFPGSKNHAAPTRSPAHVRKIAEREYFRLPISNCRF